MALVKYQQIFANDGGSAQFEFRAVVYRDVRKIQVLADRNSKDHPSCFSTDGSTAVIVDNGAASLVGSWSTSTTQSGYQGSDYLTDGGTGKGSKTATYTPTLAVAGRYSVQIKYPEDAATPTFSNNVPVSIAHASGTASVTVNEQTNGGNWVTLGKYDFAAGTSGSAQISTTGTSGLVVADGFKWSLSSYAADGGTILVTFFPTCVLSETEIKDYIDLWVEWYARPYGSSTWTLFNAGQALPLTETTESTTCADIFDFVPNRIQAAEYSPQFNREIVDLGYSIPQLIQRTAPHIMTFSNTYTFFDDSECAEIQDFFFSKFGSAKRFCLPSWQADAVLSQDANSGATTIYVERYAGLLIATRLFFDFGDTYFTTRVAFSGGTYLQLADPLPQALPKGFGISAVHFVTFSDDTLTIEHETNSIGNITIGFTQAL